MSCCRCSVLKLNVLFLTQLNNVASKWLLRNWSRPWLNFTYWLQVVAALDKAPLTVSDATKRGLLIGAKYRSEACQNIRHDRQTRSPRRISYVSPSPGSAAESSDMTDSHGSSPCAQASSTLSSARVQPCSQQGPDLGGWGVSQGPPSGSLQQQCLGLLLQQLQG